MDNGIDSSLILSGIDSPLSIKSLDYPSLVEKLSAYSKTLDGLSRKYSQLKGLADSTDCHNSVPIRLMFNDEPVDVFMSRLSSSLRSELMTQMTNCIFYDMTNCADTLKELTAAVSDILASAARTQLVNEAVPPDEPPDRPDPPAENYAAEPLEYPPEEAF